MSKEQLLEESLAHVQMSLDEALVAFDLTHKQWRRYLAKQHKELPPITPGLVQEVLFADGPVAGTANSFNLKPQQVSAINSGLIKGTEVDQRKSRDQRNAEIYADLQAGLTTVQISHKYGLTQSRISSLARELGLRPPRMRAARKNITEENYLDILRDYNAGMHKKEIAEKHKRSITTIYKVLHDAGIY